jgi:ABC-type phosphate transport system auxiliary subunit
MTVVGEPIEELAKAITDRQIQIEGSLVGARQDLDRLITRKRRLQAALRRVSDQEDVARAELNHRVVLATSVGIRQNRIAELIDRSREYVRKAVLGSSKKTPEGGAQ